MGSSAISTQYAVYIHKDAEGVVFYVGKGKGKRPYLKHGRTASWRDRARNGFSVEVVNVFSESEDADKLEKELIAKYGKVFSGGTLCNITDGGKGSLGLTHSEESKLKVSIAKKGQIPPNKGKPLSEEQKKSHSERMKGRPAHNKGKKMSDEQVAKMRGRKLTAIQKKAFSDIHRERNQFATKGYFKAPCGRYISQITVLGKTHHLGFFNEIEQANTAYVWCREQLQQFGQVDISRFRKNKNQPIIIKENI